MHVSQKNLEKKFFFRIFWVSLRVLVSMESTIWVRAAPVQCGYGTRTRTVRVFWYTSDFLGYLKPNEPKGIF